MTNEISDRTQNSIIAHTPNSKIVRSTCYGQTR